MARSLPKNEDGLMIVSEQVHCGCSLVCPSAIAVPILIGLHPLSDAPVSFKTVSGMLSQSEGGKRESRADIRPVASRQILMISFEGKEREQKKKRNSHNSSE